MTVPSVASRVIEIGICAYEQDPCATLLVGLVYYGPIASAVRNDVRSAGAARAGLPLRIPRPALALPEAEHFSLTLSHSRLDTIYGSCAPSPTAPSLQLSTPVSLVRRKPQESRDSACADASACGATSEISCSSWAPRGAWAPSH